MNIQIDKRDFEILSEILNKHPYNFFVYGSRAKETADRFSDLDLCYKEEIPLDKLSTLKAELEESNISIKVELSNYHSFSNDFKKMIDKDLKILPIE